MALKTTQTNQLSLSLDSEQIQLRKDRTVAQHNDLVQAQYDMSLTELRLFVAMLARVNKGDTEFHINRIPIYELFPEKSVNGNIGGSRYATVKEAVIDLTHKAVSVESKDQNGLKTILSIPLMASCEYKQRSGHISGQFNNHVKKYLLDLKGEFTVAQELTLLEFNSSYSHRLYWLLKKSSFQGDTIKIYIENLRKMLKLNDKYPKFKDFRINVIELAQKDLVSTDMAFTFTPLYEGKPVIAIVFHLQRPVLIQLAEPEIEFPANVQQKLTEIGINLKSLHQIKQLFSDGKIAEDYINFVIRYYQQVNTKGKLRSLSGAIFKGIIANQLKREFDLDNEQNKPPVYKAPQPKPTPIQPEEVLPFSELKLSWETLVRKQLSDCNTFEENIAKYYANNPMYRIEERNGEQCVIVIQKSA